MLINFTAAEVIRICYTKYLLRGSQINMKICIKNHGLMRGLQLGK